jgi:hypothetical protein
MGEMVDRLTKAIAGIMGDPGDPPELAAQAAHAVLEAMREPTEQMERAGGVSAGDERGNPDESSARCVWGVMIDAAREG